MRCVWLQSLRLTRWLHGPREESTDEKIPKRALWLSKATVRFLPCEVTFLSAEENDLDHDLELCVRDANMVPIILFLTWE